MTVFGTRPQYIKLSVLWRRLEERFRSVLIDSGQHYDFALSGIFHKETGLRRPDHCLNVGSTSAAGQIARVAEQMDRQIARRRPAAVIVIGDTSTTAGGALAAAFRNIPLAHVEAGLRSYDQTTLEEKNRVIADHLATWRFCPSAAAMAHLRSEGITSGVVGTGDVLYENWRRWHKHVDVAETLGRWGLAPKGYYFVTCHRAQNVDDPARLRHLTAILRALERPAIFAVHPRARKNLRHLGLWDALRRVAGLRLVPPLPYLTSQGLIAGARAVLTDSGGIQREAYWSQTPCVVLRDRTEWAELITCGAGTLVDLDADLACRALRRRWRRRPLNDRFFGLPNASARIVARLSQDLSR